MVIMNGNDGNKKYNKEKLKTRLAAKLFECDASYIEK